MALRRSEMPRYCHHCSCPAHMRSMASWLVVDVHQQHMSEWLLPAGSARVSTAIYWCSHCETGCHSKWEASFSAHSVADLALILVLISARKLS
eukprot:3588414-Amphidinium_carterae.1